MSARSLSFPRRARLTLAKQYAAVYDAKARKSRGPLTVFAMPNALDHPRLGLAIARKVGSAVVRARLKRMLREAFRHDQHAYPPSPRGCYDLVINARAHDPAPLSAYRAWLGEALAALDREWHKRAAKEARHDA